MVVTAGGRIVAVEPMEQPENNAVVTKALLRILASYPNVNCYIMDRNCKYARTVENTAGLKQLKYLPIDKMPAKGHKRSCVHNPKSSLRFRRRIAKVNPQAAEQTFSWFWGYARMLNEMRPSRREFLVMDFAKRHNQ